MFEVYNLIPMLAKHISVTDVAAEWKLGKNLN